MLTASSGALPPLASAAFTAQQAGQALLAYDVRAIDGPVFVYPAAVAATSSVVDPAALRRVVIAPAHTVTVNQTRLLVTTPNSTQIYLVTAFNTSRTG